MDRFLWFRSARRGATPAHLPRNSPPKRGFPRKEKCRAYFSPPRESPILSWIDDGSRAPRPCDPIEVEPQRKERMRPVFFVLVGLSILIDVALGAWASVSWESFANVWFEDPSAVINPGTRVVGLVLGCALLFYAALQAFAWKLIRSDDDSGFHLMIGFGGYLLISALATFGWASVNGEVLKFDGFEFLAVDGLRGILLGITAFVAMREPATVSELRLPKKHERRVRSGERSESSDRRRRGPRKGSERRSSGGQRAERSTRAGSSRRDDRSRRRRPRRESASRERSGARQRDASVGAA